MGVSTLPEGFGSLELAEVDIAKPPETTVTETQRWLIEEIRQAYRRWVNRSNPRQTDNPYPMADLLGSLLAVVDQIAPKGARGG